MYGDATKLLDMHPEMRKVGPGPDTALVRWIIAYERSMRAERSEKRAFTALLPLLTQPLWMRRQMSRAILFVTTRENALPMATGARRGGRGATAWNGGTADRGGFAARGGCGCGVVVGHDGFGCVFPLERYAQTRRNRGSSTRSCHALGGGWSTSGGTSLLGLHFA